MDEQDKVKLEIAKEKCNLAIQNLKKQIALGKEVLEDITNEKTRIYAGMQLQQVEEYADKLRDFPGEQLTALFVSQHLDEILKLKQYCEDIITKLMASIDQEEYDDQIIEEPARGKYDDHHSGKHNEARSKEQRDVSIPPEGNHAADEQAGNLKDKTDQQDKKDRIDESHAAIIARNLAMVNVITDKNVATVLETLEALERQEEARKNSILSRGYVTLRRNIAREYEVYRKGEKPGESDRYHKAKKYLEHAINRPGWGVKTHISSYPALSPQEVQKRIQHAEKVIAEADLIGTEDIIKQLMEVYIARLNFMKIDGKRVKQGDYFSIAQIPAWPPVIFNGPPGTGKTTIMEVLAKAFNMGYDFKSMQGKKEKEEVLGYAPQWVTPSPSMLVLGQEKEGVSQIIQSYDEVEKVKDPVFQAYTQLFEKNQASIYDTYFEADIDKRDVWVMGTCNDFYAIPDYIRDRVVRVDHNGYSEDEKIYILKKMAVKKLGRWGDAIKIITTDLMDFREGNITIKNLKGEPKTYQKKLPTYDLTLGSTSHAPGKTETHPFEGFKKGSKDSEDAIRFLVENYITLPGLREAEAFLSTVINSAMGQKDIQELDITVDYIRKLLGKPRTQNKQFMKNIADQEQLRNQLLEDFVMPLRLVAEPMSLGEAKILQEKMQDLLKVTEHLNGLRNQLIKNLAEERRALHAKGGDTGKLSEEFAKQMKDLEAAINQTEMDNERLKAHLEARVALEAILANKLKNKTLSDIERENLIRHAVVILSNQDPRDSKSREAFIQRLGLAPSDISSIYERLRAISELEELLARKKLNREELDRLFSHAKIVLSNLDPNDFRAKALLLERLKKTELTQNQIAALQLGAAIPSAGKTPVQPESDQQGKESPYADKYSGERRGFNENRRFKSKDEVFEHEDEVDYGDKGDYGDEQDDDENEVAHQDKDEFYRKNKSNQEDQDEADYGDEEDYGEGDFDNDSSARKRNFGARERLLFLRQEERLRKEREQLERAREKERERKRDLESEKSAEYEEKSKAKPKDKNTGKASASAARVVVGSAGSLFFSERVAEEIKKSERFVKSVVKSDSIISAEVFKDIVHDLSNDLSEIQHDLIQAKAKGINLGDDQASFEGLKLVGNPDSGCVKIIRTITASPITPKSKYHPAPLVETHRDVLSITHKGKTLELEALDKPPKDDALYSMVLTAKKAADRLGKKRFTIENCEDNPRVAFKLYLIGKSMGLQPVFKEDRNAYPEGTTIQGILQGQFSKESLITDSGKKTIKEIYQEIESKGAIISPQEIDTLKHYIADLEDLEESPQGAPTRKF